MKLKNIVIVILAFFAWIFMVGLAFVRPVSIAGRSMEPNYNHKEQYISVINVPFNYKKEDVVLYERVDRKNMQFIGRIKGTQGDTVAIQNKDVVILDESYYILGDNTYHSEDSRIFGLVPKKNIKGKVFFRYYQPK